MSITVAVILAILGSTGFFSLIIWLLSKRKFHADTHKTIADTSLVKAQEEGEKAKSVEQFVDTITGLLAKVRELSEDTPKLERALEECRKEGLDMKKRVAEAQDGLRSEMVKMKQEMKEEIMQELAALAAKVDAVEVKQEKTQ